MGERPGAHPPAHARPGLLLVGLGQVETHRAGPGEHVGWHLTVVARTTASAHRSTYRHTGCSDASRSVIDMMATAIV